MLMEIINKKIYQLRKIGNNTWKIVIFFLIIGLFVGLRTVLAADLTTSNVVSGSLGAAVASLIGWITSVLSSIVGLILTLLIKILVNVVQFNNIINVQAVSTGWVIVRDLCNMFFILILLVIAFATILRMESYQWKKMLPKLLIMAVLINFSKTICGLIIDFAQVIMLTFVNGFSQYGAANFINLFNLQNYQSIKVIGLSQGGEITNFSVAGAFIAGFIAMIITAIVVLVMLAVFIIRVIMLWIYVILSPVAFLAAAFPAGQKYSSQWWSEFTKYVVSGPVLAFFIWLALTTAIKSSETLGSFGGEFCAGINAFFCEKNLQTYIITIGLLVGGLMVTQQVGGIAGSIAGKGLGWAKKAGGLPAYLGKYGVYKAGRGLDTLQMKAQKGIMERLFKVPEYHAKSLNYRMIAAGWKKNREESLERYETFGGKGAHLSTVWRENFKKHLQFRQYGALRISQRKFIENKKQAEKLQNQDKIDRNRINLAKLPVNDRARLQRKYDDAAYKKKKILEYEKMGLKGEDEVKKDMDIIGGEETFNINEAENRIKGNEPVIKKLSDARRFGIISADKAEPFVYEKSKAGAQDVIDNAYKDMKTETGGVDFKVNQRLLKAVKENDTKNIIAALRIQNENNNFNEVLKDHRLVELMTKSNGLLEKLNRKGVLAKGADGKGRALDNNELQILKNDVRNRPVTPAHMQALIRGVLTDAGMRDNVAARHAADLGERSFVAGNGMAYGMAMGDEASGDYKFEDFNFANGRLQTSDRRKAAVAAKFSNIESQAKMRMMHPDLYIAEAADGSAVDLTEDGKYMIQSLSAHDFGQIGRMRPDVVNKMAASEEVLEGFEKLAEELEKVDKNAADLVRFMGGYMISAREKPKIKDYDKILKTMEERFRSQADKANKPKIPEKPEEPEEFEDLSKD